MSPYPQRMIEAIHATGRAPSLGGIEFAEDIVGAMGIDRASRGDESFRRFVEALRAERRRWQS